MALKSLMAKKPVGVGVEAPSSSLRNNPAGVAGDARGRWPATGEAADRAPLSEEEEDMEAVTLVLEKSNFLRLPM